MLCPRPLFLAALLALVAASVSAQPLQTLDGHRFAWTPAPDAVTVFILVSPDCPISNRFAPDLQRLGARLAGTASVSLVYPGPRVTPDAIREHARAHNLALPLLRDPSFGFARDVGATVTPEAAVFRGRTLMYHGRIDDRFTSVTTMRPRPTSHDLDEAIAAVLAGRPVAQPVTPAVGCFLEFPQ